ncbi:MAG: hypothetical protein ACI9E5_000392, partial [Candidatus Omnitrophota bacterium]
TIFLTEIAISELFVILEIREEENTS